MARMRYNIVFAPEAVEDYKKLKANLRSTVRNAIELHLRHQPTKMSKGRIKRLRGMRKPQYRLRVEDVRIFYDVAGKTLEVLAIVEKSQATGWLESAGETE
jgi:mRNA interferase RelE/StbE